MSCSRTKVWGENVSKNARFICSKTRAMRSVFEGSWRCAFQRLIFPVTVVIGQLWETLGSNCIERLAVRAIACERR